MMKYIKFTLSKGGSITLPMDKAERLVDSEGQLLKIPDERGLWSGKTINKAHIVSTDIDHEMTRKKEEEEKMNSIKLSTPKMTEKQILENREKIDKIRKEFGFRIIKKLNI